MIINLLNILRSRNCSAISNDSYAHDEQGFNPGQVRGFDGVLYKL